MSDYYGTANLESWLQHEVFDGQTVPTEVVALFERWREPVERSIESWLETDDGDGASSWRDWGRGYAGIPDEDDEAINDAIRSGHNIIRQLNSQNRCGN